MTPFKQSYRGFIYLLGSKKFGWYKIGRCTTPRIRVRDLGILLPFSIELIALWKVENPISSERHMHLIYQKNHINGEWFSFFPDEIRAILETETAFHSVRIVPSEEDGRIPIPCPDLFKDIVKLESKVHKRQIRMEFGKAVMASMAERGIENTLENRLEASKWLAQSIGDKSRSGILALLRPERFERSVRKIRGIRSS